MATVDDATLWQEERSPVILLIAIYLPVFQSSLSHEYLKIT